MIQVKKYLPYVLCLILGCVLFSLVPKCDHKVRGLIPIGIDSTSIWKKQIAIHSKRVDSLKVIASKKDTVFIKGQDHWYKEKAKFSDIKNLPCDSVKKEVPVLISDCDSVINKANDLIHTLKDEQTETDLVVQEQKKVIVKDSIKLYNDSLIIKDLTHQVKSQKTQKKIIASVGLIGWIIAAFK